MLAVTAVLKLAEEKSFKATVSPDAKVPLVLPNDTPLRNISVQPTHDNELTTHEKLSPDNVTALLVISLLRLTPV